MTVNTSELMMEELWGEACAAVLYACLRGSPDGVIQQYAHAMFTFRCALPASSIERFAIPYSPPLSRVSTGREG